MTLHLCSRCRFAFDVEPIAVLVNGRLVLELRLCAACRVEALEALEAVADEVAK